jgi:hypothetical protein
MNIAFIIGCARSGTSILGELIADHGEVKYIFEANHMWELDGLGVNESHRLTAEDASVTVTKRIRQWFEEQKGLACLLVEKNPRNTLRIPFILKIFPEATIIHIIRDGRDVACSMVPGCGGTEWRHLKPPSWNELLSSHKGVVRCALTWREVVTLALRDLKHVPHLQVKYEEMVKHPCDVARKILNYLKLRQDTAVMEFCDNIQDRTAGSYHAQR